MRKRTDKGVKMLKDKKVLIIGSGNMARSLALGLKGKSDVTIIDPVSKGTAGEFANANGFKLGAPDDILTGDVVILAFKPQNLPAASEMYGTYFTKNQLVISILAGIQISMLEKFTGDGVRVIRTMPNLALMVSKSATAYALGSYATESDGTLCEEIFSMLGVVKKVNESDIDTVTALSGSGPAYIYLLAECMENAAIKLGLPKDVAKTFTKQTFSGAVKLWDNEEESATELRKRITSAKGTTEAAVNTMLEEKIEEVILDGVTAAQKRSIELAKEMLK